MASRHREILQISCTFSKFSTLERKGSTTERSYDKGFDVRAMRLGEASHTIVAIHLMQRWSFFYFTTPVQRDTPNVCDICGEACIYSGLLRGLVVSELCNILSSGCLADRLPDGELIPIPLLWHPLGTNTSISISVSLRVRRRSLPRSRNPALTQEILRCRRLHVRTGKHTHGDV